MKKNWCTCKATEDEDHASSCALTQIYKYQHEAQTYERAYRGLDKRYRVMNRNLQSQVKELQMTGRFSGKYTLSEIENQKELNHLYNELNIKDEEAKIVHTYLSRVSEHIFMASVYNDIPRIKRYLQKAIDEIAKYNVEIKKNMAKREE